MSSDKKAPAAPDFEKSMERLEKIVREMEDGSLSLEKMMRYFEEGMRLVDICSHKLNEVERKIEVLLKKHDELKLAPFQPEAGDNQPEDKETDDATDR